MRLPRFKTILMDPPWPERGAGKIKRGADRHYPLLKVKDMPRVILYSGAFRWARSCHLWMWVTNNYLKDGLWLMEELGFRYVTKKTWAKPKAGIGQYMAGQTEDCLFGVSGPAMMPTKKLAATTLLGRGLVPHEKNELTGKIIHSGKPQIMYDEIEVVSPGPYLEMFATDTRPGWHSWGKFYGPEEEAVVRFQPKRGGPEKEMNPPDRR